MICTPINPSCKNCPIQKSMQNFSNESARYNSLGFQKIRKKKNINWLLIASRDKVLLKEM